MSAFGDAQNASLVRAPNDLDRTAGDFGVRKYDVTVTSQANAVPAGWAGNWVSMYSPVEVDYAFSIRSAATVSNAVAATAAGASALVGGKILAGERRDVLLPAINSRASNTILYFVRQGPSTSYVLIEFSNPSAPDGTP
jgi:hypothetical protein